MHRLQTNRPRLQPSPTSLLTETIGKYALALLVLIGLSGCSSASKDSAGEEQPTIVTTLHPFATVLRPIVGEAGTVTALLPPSVSPHTYSPRPSDARTAANSQLLIFGHDHLDGWAANIEAPAHIELFALVPDSLRLSFPRGVLEHQTRPAGHDPHFWTDPVTVSAIVAPLVDTLCDQMPAHCSTFQTNGSAFLTRLASLHEQLLRQTKPLRGRSVLLATPFFQYFLDRYDLTLAGVIEPIPGAEIAPRTLQEIIETAREREIGVILAARQQSARQAETISTETGIPLLELDLIAGEERTSTYETMMLNNVNLLVKALD